MSADRGGALETGHDGTMARVPGAPPVLDESVRATLAGERIEEVREALGRQGGGAALLDSRADTAWLTVGGELHVVQGSDTAASAILVTRDRAILVAPENEADRVADEEIAGLPLELEAVPWHEPDAARRLAHRAGGGPVLEGRDLDALVAPLRMHLASPEHDRLRWLAAAAGAALDGATAAMLPGRTGLEVAAALVTPLLATGVRTPVVLAGADGRMRYRHPLPGSEPLVDRMMLVLVAERWGLHVAATRMAWLSGEPGAVHPADAAAGRVLERMVAASRPGTTLGEVLEVAARAYAAEGMPDEWRRHHQGGVIGYLPRERIAVPGDPTVLEPGMAVAWNPSVPGGKAEATLLVTDDDPELLLG